MGHAEIEGETREKKIINLERLIAREKEVEEKKTSDCRLKEGRGREREERDGRFAQNGSLCNPEIQKGEEINTLLRRKKRVWRRHCH